MTMSEKKKPFYKSMTSITSIFHKKRSIATCVDTEENIRVIVPQMSSSSGLYYDARTYSYKEKSEINENLHHYEDKRYQYLYDSKTMQYVRFSFNGMLEIEHSTSPKETEVPVSMSSGYVTGEGFSISIHEEETEKYLSFKVPIELIFFQLKDEILKKIARWRPANCDKMAVYFARTEDDLLMMNPDELAKPVGKNMDFEIKYFYE